MAIRIHDDGDKYDKEKWDFDERSIPVHIIGKYPYKAFNKKNAEILADIRLNIDRLCLNIEASRDIWSKATHNIEYLNGVEIFLGIHKEYMYPPKNLPEPFYSIARKGLKTSRYLISEIPKGTKFDGLDKPKARYIDRNAPFVGKDGQERALYRDIFLNLGIQEDSLKKLIIHELAHTMANHVRYRPDDHHVDFKWCETLIGQCWPDF